MFVQLTVSCIVCVISLALFFAIMIILINDLCNGHRLTISDKKECMITAIIGLVIFVISLFFFIKYYTLPDSPNVVHERLLDNLDRVEEELKKFYMNNPEFKEITE